MRDIKDIKKNYEEKAKELNKEKITELEHTLRELCEGYLDVDVIRKSTGNRGVLKLELEGNSSFRLVFHPYLKDGSRPSLKGYPYYFLWDNKTVLEVLSNYEIVKE